VDHFQGTSMDTGWGCGWRNIQMLASALLQRNPVRFSALPCLGPPQSCLQHPKPGTAGPAHSFVGKP
jgi:hypothetical protein